jgi:CysZ protein
MEPLHLFLPIGRAVSQLSDAAFRAVLLRSVAWSAMSFIALNVAAILVVNRLLEFHGWLAWALDLLGSVGASLLAFWLFLPVAAAIGMLYLDKIAAAVERRFYPWLDRPRGASLIEQTWDGVAVALKVLALNVVALILTFMLPGVGLILGWLIAAYAIGRGLFVAVAMRRMPRDVAESLYLARRGMVLVQGGILASAAYIPLVNLLIPIVGTAAMVHVLDMALTTRRLSKQ